MSLYEIDFLDKLQVLLKEAFKFKKYKAMPAVLAVFTGILMLPLVIASLAVAAFLAVLCFMFIVLSAPVKYFHDIVHGEGQTVKHATQTVIYLISWPVLSIMYLLMSFLLLLILPTYALLSVLLYAWSLGGFKFHLFMNKLEDISIEVNGTYRVLPLVFVIIGGVIVVFTPLIHGIICYADMYANYMERYFFQHFFSNIYSVYLSVHCAFAFLYSLIGFAPRPKACPEKNVDEIAE